MRMAVTVPLTKVQHAAGADDDDAVGDAAAATDDDDAVDDAAAVDDAEFGGPGSLEPVPSGPPPAIFRATVKCFFPNVRTSTPLTGCDPGGHTCSHWLTRR